MVAEDDAEQDDAEQDEAGHDEAGSGDDRGGAPFPLRSVEELVNTRSVELSTDELPTPRAVEVWLRERNLLPADVAVTPAGHRRALRLREGLRALLATHNGEPTRAPGAPDGVDPGSAADLAGLAALAGDLPLVLDVRAEPPALVAARPGSVDAALANLLATVARAAADGTWTRLKVCREPGCRWAYYDHSRNRSRAWCSMASCGNRAKARTFRRRSQGGADRVRGGR